MVLADSSGISRAPEYSGAVQAVCSFAYGALTLCGRPSQTSQLERAVHADGPTTPLCMHNGLGWSPFAHHYSGNRDFFLLLQVLRCFSSLRLPPKPMYSVSDDGALPPPGFPIRTSPDHRSLAATRSFSQLTTSFIASWCQGILREPLVA
jgi:hypothetical protein